MTRNLGFKTRYASCLAPDDDPYTFYHATPAKNVDMIMAFGLAPGEGETFGLKDWSSGKVFLAYGKRAALAWKQAVFYQSFGHIEIIEVKLTPQQLPYVQVDTVALEDDDACAFYVTRTIPAGALRLTHDDEWRGYARREGFVDFSDIKDTMSAEALERRRRLRQRVYEQRMKRKQRARKNPAAKAVFTGWTCVEGPESLVHYLVEHAREVEYRTFAEHVDVQTAPQEDWAIEMFPTDWACTWLHTQLPSGQDAWVMQHSGIEHLFTVDAPSGDEADLAEEWWMAQADDVWHCRICNGPKP